VAPKASIPVKQLPPSPPPATKVLVRLPSPFSEPRPFSQTRTVAFLADNKLQSASGGLYPRLSNQYSYDAGYHLHGSGACLEHKTYLNVQERLSTWDPYWRILEDVGLRHVKASSSGHTWVGTRTTACIPNIKLPTNSCSVNSCASLHLNIPSLSNNELLACVKWGEHASPEGCSRRNKLNYTTGDKRLILRTLPLFRNAKEQKKRADTHIWPKGTFIQHDDCIIPISQRRQEKHDEKVCFSYKTNA
jgi:hypothetical protein